MYNLRPDLVLEMQGANSIVQLKQSVLHALSEIGTDLDRLFAADKTARRELKSTQARLEALERNVRALAEQVSLLARRSTPRARPNRGTDQ